MIIVMMILAVDYGDDDGGGCNCDSDDEVVEVPVV